MPDESVKVHVDLPNHWAIGGEAMWAKPLGSNRFQLENVPFYAYDLNIGDVVVAIAESPDLIPSVRRVLERSGHQTLRVFFNELPRERCDAYLGTLRELRVSYERATARYVALDLEPAASLDDVRDVLDSWSAQGVAEYETCEARVTGSFDDAPDDSEDP